MIFKLTWSDPKIYCIPASTVFHRHFSLSIGACSLAVISMPNTYVQYRKQPSDVILSWIIAGCMILERNSTRTGPDSATLASRNLGWTSGTIPSQVLAPRIPPLQENYSDTRTSRSVSISARTYRRRSLGWRLPFTLDTVPPLLSTKQDRDEVHLVSSHQVG